MTTDDGTCGGSAGLRASYEACATEMRQRLPPIWAATELLPAAVRPQMHALHHFALRTDRIADEGPPEHRERRLARWRAEVLQDLRAGHSAHPLRRAFVDTVCRRELDRAVIEEFLDATRADCSHPPVFETFVDQRRYLRGVAGTIAETWAQLLAPGQPQARQLASVLGEASQLADIFEDLPVDLAAGRCYLPRADIRGLGLDVDALRRGTDRDALDELLDVQLARWYDLLEQALPVTAKVGPEYHSFLQAVILGVQLQYDELSLLKSRAFVAGLEPLAVAGAAPRRPVPAASGPVPGHVAVIMDGNRRWAALRGLRASDGHHAGERAAIRLVNAGLRLGIRHLSIYAFSTENWNRRREELTALFDLMADAIARGGEWLHEAGVRVRWCGRRDRIDPSLASALALVESMTSNNDVLSLTFCVDYGGRDELVAAARALAAEAAAGTIRPADIGPADLARNLHVPDLPDVDLLIRTSGEQRISNFLPWHISYAELLFDPTFWPDFGLTRLRAAVAEYARRDRRFGAGIPGPASPTEPARMG